MKYAPFGCTPGSVAVRNAVAVDVEVAVERLDLLELLGAEHLAAIRHVVVVPLELRDHPVVHADVEIGQHEDRRLQALGEVEGHRRHLEALLGIRRKQQHVLGVAVRRVGAARRSPCCVRVGMPVDGPVRCTSKKTAGISA